MRKMIAAALLGSAMVIAQPAFAGSFLLEVGAIENPNAGGNNDTPKFRVVNNTSGSAFTPYLNSLVLTLASGNTITGISSFGQNDYQTGNDDGASLGSPSAVISNLGKTGTITYGALQFDPGVYSTFGVNFGPSSMENFRTALAGATLTALFSDNTTASVSFSSSSFVPSGNAFYTFNSVSGAVPEPASWALMIIGFGAAGVAMRRRKVRIAYA